MSCDDIDLALKHALCLGVCYLQQQQQQETVIEQKCNVDVQLYVGVAHYGGYNTHKLRSLRPNDGYVSAWFIILIVSESDNLPNRKMIGMRACVRVCVRMTSLAADEWKLWRVCFEWTKENVLSSYLRLTIYHHNIHYNIDNED